ncbi:Asp-tRNA(Asn)/Glu-tRNA(Gln) amidotransferase subunit GatA [Papillibacter cinnamivorans]|uniref:Glutamyl-tRNA(Gln) amidotransferase subunit A n=1 Tax=Papillibacter cinnamivorans DSM 12816 TaxID=1122930 RepID=A0A1W2CN61_9FIRM|nr:Asp-tRNA(Asn)/Glu-tRNA(Gln) amidotransferase subunit GatA [Papillibacter cinnamivorans]SMC86687.1 aspartyl/glutamyl-tRNA(Asn/Gln) amidotransferase subunit A [Papillibacter cinnamivorans DSM 12816]
MGKIAQLHRLLETKKISCKELTEAYLRAIEADNKALNAYVRITPDTALQAACAVDKKIAAGEAICLLEGIPMTLKDNISTRGMETACCSRILQGYVPIYDAFVWQELKARNAVLLGKANMDEFAMGSTCENSCYGGAKNPRNLTHVSGGSSGGAASAVGGNLAVYGLGSDTGGSIRQPASFCGLVGLKPTYGAVSRFGLVAFASSLDQIGPITQDAEDAAIVFDAISGKDPQDSTSCGSEEPAVPGLSKSLSGLRVGIAEEYFEGIRGDVKASLEQAISVFREMGAELVPVGLPSIRYALPVYYILACAEASSNLGRYDGIRYGYQAAGYSSIHDMICRTRSEGFGAEVKRRILLGTYVLSSGYYDAYYKKAQKLRGAVIQDFTEAFSRCDMILAPTVPMTAFESGSAGQRDAVETYLTDICTVPVNIAGIPAVSVPCGLDGEGLPIGMQLIGNHFRERTILNAARQYEEATGRVWIRSAEMGVKL